ncbi:hypothetical protein BT69DRAFT_1345980 [Atractiella rhizophila]|nr:hypothetical protein BT69DRAFT_1345980 [Atractiella rhizophila]
MAILSQSSQTSIISSQGADDVGDPLFPFPLSGSTVATSFSAFPPSSQMSQAADPTKPQIMGEVTGAKANGIVTEGMETDADAVGSEEAMEDGEDGDSLAEEERRKQMVEKVLRRAEIGKASRQFQKRLELAKFKAARGWSHLSLDQFEPLYNREIEEQQSRKRKLAANPKRPPTMNDSGLFDHLLSPSRGPIRAPSRPNGQLLYASPSRRRQLSNSSSSRVAINQPGSPIPQSSVRGTSQQPQVLSTSDPSFSGAANEFLSAADALNSMSKGGPNSPSRLGKNRHRSEEESDKESAAELMLYLAQSPSPAQTGRMGGGPIGGEGVKGRRLFEGSEFGSAHQQRSRTNTAGSSSLLGPPAQFERSGPPTPSPATHGHNTISASALLPPRSSLHQTPGSRVYNNFDFLQSPTAPTATVGSPMRR